MILIRAEIQDIIDGRPASHQQCAQKRSTHRSGGDGLAMGSLLQPGAGSYPAPWVKEHKFWPHVGRIDEAYGDRNLSCTRPPMDSARPRTLVPCPRQRRQ